MTPERWTISFAGGFISLLAIVINALHVVAVAGQSIILLAEDCSDDVFFLQRAVKTAGLLHSVFRVCNGVECIAYLKGEPPYDDRLKFPFPHLLLLDLKMPLLCGFDVLIWLQTQPALRHLPVVVLTGSVIPEDELATRNLGARGFYSKQSDPAALSAILKAIDADWLSDPANPNR